MQKRWQNFIGGTGFIWPVIYFLIKALLALLELLGMIDTVNQHKDILNFYNNPNINWIAVNAFILVMSIVYLVTVNFDSLWRKYKAHLKSKVVTWDTPIKKAISYVEYESSFCSSIKDNQALILSCEAIRQAVRDGSLPIAGSTAENIKTTLIPSFSFKSMDIAIEINVNHSRRSVGNCFIHPKEVKKEVVYFNLFFDMKNLKEIWPTSD